jgi:CRISPR/Cas system-associated exonuclease Cas4 (RecB family)
MEEAYRKWQQGAQFQRFPWNWDTDIRDIELEIDRRLRAGGLYPPPRLFCPYTASTTTQGLCPDANHPHKLIASNRTEAAINTWGPHLFPLIHESEVRLKGIRSMPGYQPNVSRSNYYGINGVVDVLSSVKLQTSRPGNLILRYIHQNSELQQMINNLNTDEYEIIIDYKGMRRPSATSPPWQYHEWQILTYAWLRSKEPQSKPVVAGILFYLNELFPSREDMKELKNDVASGSTDIMPQGLDLRNIQNWRQNAPVPQLTGPFREARSIRIICCDPSYIQNALQRFDAVINEIENCVLSEMRGNNITSSWQPNPDQRTCTACDFKTFCPNPAPGPYRPTVP